MTKISFTSPVGRLVQGSVDEAQTTDMHGQLRVVKTGPNIGQPNPQFFVAIAIAKNDPAWPAMWEKIVNAAVSGFPGLFPQGAAPVIAAGGPNAYGKPHQGHCTHPKFTFKVKDGDGVDDNGKQNSAKEGFAGHWILSATRTGSFGAPRCFRAGKYAPHEQIQEAGAVKRGYYVRLSGSLEGNDNAQNPGIYVNLDMVELSAFGPEIVSGPDANEAFAGGPAALPPGATAAPQTPQAPPPAQTGLLSAGVPPQTPASAPVVGGMPPGGTPAAALAAPGAPVAPYNGYMQQPGAVAPPPPAAPAAAPPPPAPARQMLPAAGGHSYESLIAAGWTDETLRANGMMA